MIETVINLRGEPEKFDARKLNHWVQDAVGGINVEEWSEIALATVNDMPEEVTVQQLMKKLIDTLLDRESWSHYLMAGRLLAILNRIEIFGSKEVPTVATVQQRLAEAGLMRTLNYSPYEWTQIEKAINHDLDMESPHFALEQIRYKYSLQDFSSGAEFETPQFVYMRMAMALFESHPETPEDYPLINEDPSERSRLEHVLRIYDHFSKKRLSAPTPNYNNLGTFHRGYASCCLIAVGDERWSLAVGDHITYMMTTQSAGIGINKMVRSLGDPVQKGRFLHRGKLPYIGTFGKNIRANLQGGRGGAGTDYISLFDPEARVVTGLRDTRASDTARNRDAHYAYLTNRFLMMKAAKDEDIFTWNVKTAPELHKAFYGPDIKKFAELYKKLQDDSTFKKNYVSARSLLVHAITQGFQTGTIYAADIGEMNRNTPFLDAIHSSNLCLEVSEPTEAYTGPMAMMDLYSDREVGYAKFTAVDDVTGAEHNYDVLASIVFPSPEGKWIAQDVAVGKKINHRVHGLQTVTAVRAVKREPEVALCSLAATNVTEEMDGETYRDVMYYAYKMIDYCILENEYILPHIGVTAKARMNAGVGIMGVATHMARRKLKFNTRAGLEELHRLYERHLYYAIEASIQISKERGLAPWIERTKWPEGWTPLQDYRREVDALGDFKYEFDWSMETGIAGRIKANGGLAHSCLINFMPGESSSKALGATNSIYGIRKLTMNKVDANNILRWAAPYGDNPEYEYQSMFDLTLIEQNSMYAVGQKFCDQSASADWFKDFRKQLTVGSTEIIEAEADRMNKGVKTRYYINTLMPESDDSMTISKSATAINADEVATRIKQRYEAALNAGFTGTYQDWVESLRSVHGVAEDGSNAYTRAVAGGFFAGSEEEFILRGGYNQSTDLPYDTAGGEAVDPELAALLAQGGIQFQQEGGDGHVECEGCSL